MNTSPAPPDSLTGLPTRALFHDLEKAFASRDPDEVWSLTLVDVDHFKLINDVYGHLAGDRVLRAVADILSRNVRFSDHVLRFGGDEFLVVMPNTGHLKAANQAQRIFDDMKTEGFPDNMKVTLSMGIASNGNPGDTLQDVFKKADQALYGAKEGGRNRFYFHQDPDQGKDPSLLTFEHFVDRQRELKALRGFLDETLNEGSRFALISGEPGVGKSRLVSELAHYCAFRGCLFLQTSCDESGPAGFSLQMTDPLRTYLLELPEAQRGHLMEALGSVHPYTAQLLRSPEVRTDPAGPPSEDPQDALRHRVFGELSSLLRIMAEERPVVFLVDDLQWMAGHDLEMLGYMARTAGGSRILFLGTLRSPAENFPEVRRWITVLSRLVPFLEVELAELDPEDAEHLIMFALRDPGVPPSVLSKLVQRSGGNPFYLRELLHSLRERGTISPRGEGGWDYRLEENEELPETVSHLIAERLRELDPLSREVMATASLVTGGFTIELLSRVLDESDIRVARALQKPLDMDLLREECPGGASPVYHFCHNMVKSVLKGEFSLGMRRAVNARLGRCMEERMEQGESDLLSTTARYFCDSLDAPKAMRYTLLAAREAMERQANREAVRWLEAYTTASVGQREDPDEAFFARYTLATLFALTADNERARESFQMALEKARTPGEEARVQVGTGQLLYNTGDYAGAREALEKGLERLPECEESLRARMRLAFMAHLQGNSEEAIRGFQDVEARIRRLPEGLMRSSLTAHCWSGMGFVMKHSRDPEKGMDLSRRAVALFNELGDRSGEARALLNLAAVLSSENAFEERIRILNRALEVFREISDENSILVAYVNLGQVYYTLGQNDRSAETFHRCASLAEVTGARRFSLWCWCYEGMLHDRMKEYDEAEACYRKAIRRAEEMGEARMLVVCQLNLAVMHIQRGTYPEGLELLEQVEQGTTIANMGPVMQGTLKMVKGMERFFHRTAGGNHPEALQSAESLFREALEVSRDMDSFMRIENLSYLARCLEAQGRREEGLAVLDEAEGMIRRILEGVRSALYRESILETPVIREVRELRRSLNPEAPPSVPEGSGGPSPDSPPDPDAER